MYSQAVTQLVHLLERAKSKPLKLLQRSPEFSSCFGSRRKSWELSPELFKDIETFTCKLDLPSSDCDDIDECRYLMFCTQTGEVDSSQLLPCCDTLYQHTLRANYQAAIWRQCMEQNMNVPDPVEFRWHMIYDCILGIT